jgi:transposase-like protein
MRILRRLICRLKGHKRGKKLAPTSTTHNRFECQRCGAQWERKARKLLS